MFFKKSTAKLAFTLAEVLITLLIIGIVASIVIPSLLQNTRNQEAIVGLKALYSNLQAGYSLALLDNGGDLSSLFDGQDNISKATNSMLSKYSIIKQCDVTGRGCFPEVNYKQLNDNLFQNPYNSSANFNDYPSSRKILLNNGMSILIDDIANFCSNDYGSGPLKNTCGLIFVDINGSKGPNKIGRDTFEFLITKLGIYPVGTTYDGSDCSISTSGVGCTGEILKTGQMNY